MHLSDTTLGQATEQGNPVGGTKGTERDHLSGPSQVQVLSRALTDVAHDIQNHLAAIKESAGWMEDLIRLKNKKRFGWIRRLVKRDDPERLAILPFLAILETIQDRVDRGSALNKRFSRFAHRQEETWSIFSANKALEEIEDVLSGEAKEKGLHFAIKLADSAAMIETDPPGFQLAVFAWMEEMTEGLESGGQVLLETEVRDGQFHMCLTCPSRAESASLQARNSNGQDFFRNVAEQLGGQIQAQPGDEKHVTTLAFPLASGET
jgi:hypothetical protein